MVNGNPGYNNINQNKLVKGFLDIIRTIEYPEL